MSFKDTPIINGSQIYLYSPQENINPQGIYYLLKPLFHFFIELTPLIEVAARVPRHSIPKLQHQIVVFLRHPGCLEVELVKVAPVLKSGKRLQAVLNILYSTEFNVGDMQ